MDTREELIQLKENTGLNWRKFSDYFAIPYRTVQDWYLGKRKMPEYLLRLMVYKFEIEQAMHLDVNGFTSQERSELARRITEVHEGHAEQHCLIES